MPFIPEGTAHVVLTVQLATLPRAAAVTWGVNSSIVTQANAANIVNDFTGQVGPIFDNQVSLGPATVTFGSASGEGLPFFVGGSVLGSLNISTASAQVAALVRKTTNVPGRKGRGRMFLPWVLQEANLDEAGLITPAQLTTIDNAMNAWRTTATAGSRNLVILHKDAITVPSNIVAFTTAQRCATQKRRLGK